MARLYEELLEQARHLARKEPRRPKDASLRRAVSAAYYSLFHLLIEDSCAFPISGPQRKELRQRLARSFVHSQMKEVSQQVAGEKSTAAPRLKNVAKTFVELQQHRHEADYSLSKKFQRFEVSGLIAQVATAIEDWKVAVTTPEAETYLVSLLVKLR